MKQTRRQNDGRSNEMVIGGAGYRRDFGGVMSRGVTLVELAVVLAIVGLVLGAILTPLGMRYQIQSNKRIQAEIDNVKDGLIGFAVTAGRLPCPDVDGDGGEDRTGPACVQFSGNIPWRTVSTGRDDGLGKTFRYAVSPEFTRIVLPGAPPTDGALDMLDFGTLALAGTPIKVPAIIMSAGIDRVFDPENLNDNDVFRYGPMTSTFDDRTVWLPRAIILHQLIRAGWMP